MQAVGYYVVIKDEASKTTETKGGLLLADAHKDDVRFKEGIIESVGSDVTGLKCCDRVLYDKHSGSGLEVGGELFKVIKAGDIAVIL